MEETIKKKLFVQLQFCAVLLACTLLPDFGSMISSALGLGGLSIVVIISRVIGLIGAGFACFKLYDGLKDQIPTPYLATMGAALVLTLITLNPGTPVWLDYIALIAMCVAIYMGKDSLNINWKLDSTQGAYIILLTTLTVRYQQLLLPLSHCVSSSSQLLESLAAHSMQREQKVFPD